MAETDDVRVKRGERRRWEAEKSEKEKKRESKKMSFRRFWLTVSFEWCFASESIKERSSRRRC